MSEYTVNFTGYQSAGVTVEADSPEAAIEAALHEGVPGICAQCSGWGQRWYRDDETEWTPESVGDDDGNTVWQRESERA